MSQARLPEETLLRLRVGGAALHLGPRPVTGALVDIEGERHYALTNFDQLPPFLVTVASDSDHFLFASSTGALTAGRRHADQALFPYTTDDKLHDAAEHTGPRTILRVRSGESQRLWEPLSIRHAGLYRVTRTLSRTVAGNQLRFSEVNRDLGLDFSYTWQSSNRLGWVRRVRLSNLGNAPTEVELLDGLQNLMPPGIGKRLQQEMSTLADAYKDSELDPATGLGIFRLSSIPVDAAEPSEALRATTIFCTGLPSPTILLSSSQLERFRQGLEVEPERRCRGRRGAFFVRANLVLEPGAEHIFHLVADGAQDAAAVVAARHLLRSGTDLEAEIRSDVARGTSRLVSMVAGADGLATTADELTTARHFSNVLFNGMRGGFPAHGYEIEREDLSGFLGSTSPRSRERHRDFLDGLPEALDLPELRERTRAQADPRLERAVSEYLPLTFSRRHGDPSRPWNEFTIAVRDPQGRPVLDYQGNWRDLFQNWEALALSYPGWLDGMINRFLGASTADGHNPYRLTRDGFEWEVEDPDDPWSFIGYWGDHQVIYLLRLLELEERFFPGRLAARREQRLLAFADVPYRIRGFEARLADPQETIDFDRPAHEAALSRAQTLGSEGKLLLDRAGEPQRASLTEKLLLVVMARLASYIPEAGLWLDTQRPEWNDANNALVGNGASVVTLCHLRRFLRFQQLWLSSAAASASQSADVAEEIAQLFEQMTRALAAADSLLTGPVSPADRRRVLESLSRPMDAYRSRIYGRGFSGERRSLSLSSIQSFYDCAARHVEHTIRQNRRDDGLFHAYNLVRITADEVHVGRLPEMLEGQVAVLSAGVLSPGGVLSVLKALRASSLYRPDQQSYLLYPDRQLPSFLEKNRISSEKVAGSPLRPLVLGLAERRHARVLVADADGDLHFHPDLRNARILERVIDGLQPPLSPGERRQLLDLYEEVFDHRSFTGRSGSFYKYEGLGCIYWHQVSKLLVAVQENLSPSALAGADPAIGSELVAHYHQIREGIGVHKPPEVYGAFPIDPYSHTPGHLGAQQPGLTGQVKEDILTRQRELGVVIEGGALKFDFRLLRREELLPAGGRFRYRDLGDEERTLPLPPRSLAFTFCQVPTILRAGSGGDAGGTVHVRFADGRQKSFPRLTLDVPTSQSIFSRQGEVVSLLVDLPAPES